MLDGSQQHPSACRSGGFLLLFLFFFPFRSHLKFSYLPSSFHRRPTCKSKPPTKPSHPSSSSKKGFDLLKDLLVTQAVSSIIPHQLPKISKSKRIPFLGNVNMVLSDVTIYEIDVGPSHFELGDDRIAVIDSGVTCNPNMNRHYSYSTWIAHVVVSDEGRASIQLGKKWMVICLKLGRLGGEAL
ncbi:hypothetical protein ACFX2I_044864 [Malus domestica]